MRLLRLLTAAASALVTLASASDVKVYNKEFTRPPNFLFYFEDSPVVMSLFVDATKGEVWRSPDNGATWEIVKGLDGKAMDLLEHPHDPKRAIILGEGKTHWKTSDRGETWDKFEVPLPMSNAQNTLSFHAQKPDYVLYAGRDCRREAIFEICEDHTYYTTDWFKTVNLLKKRTRSCIFAKGRKNFAHGEEKTVMCVVDNASKFHEHRVLEVSNNFKDWTAPKFDGINVLEGVNGLAAVEKFIVAALRSKGTDEMALYVTEDVLVWTRAEFPHDHRGLKEGAYTILESTPYSIQVDVLSADSNPYRPSGSMFTSNSNGTYFTRNIDHTNRIEEGLVDFEKIEGIEGIVLVNIVKNWDAKDPRKKKQIMSRISFDDGRADTWKPLKAGEKDLHLYSVTGFRNMGRVYSSKAPGLVMGVGNTGDHLEEYTDGDLYISDDAGLTWRKALSEAHIYEFGGSGSLLLAVYDEGPTDEARYSIDYGKTWERVDLGVKIHARILTTTPDSTSLNFVIVGIDKDKKGHVISLDFNKVLVRKCKLDKGNPDKSDFEKWYARYDEHEKPDCLMGHKEFYWRRKKDAKCNAGDLYKEPEVEEEVCECQEHDFECDFNFVRDDDGKCVQASGTKLRIPPGECKKPGDKYKGPSGYRKIPGNTCKGGVSKDEKMERTCDEANSTPPSTGEIKVKFKEFKGKMPLHYFYLDNAETSSKMDETVFMRTENQEIWVSHDGGLEWKKPNELDDVRVVDIYNNPYNYDHVYVLTGSKEFYLSTDRGRSFRKYKAPTPPNKERLPVLDFHPKNAGWLIWIGQEPDCKSTRCRSVAYATRDVSFGEKAWDPLVSNVGKCQWIRGQKQTVQSEKLIFCARIEEAFDPPKVSVKLLSSEDFFKSDPIVHFDDIIGFAKMEEFIVVASVNGTNGYLKASTSIDGRSFAPARFPHNLNVPHQTAYTVLDSNTHAVFLHVTTNDAEGYEYGSLLKSNSNGTDYVLSLDGVNRNELGYVDFEKMHSLEGVILVNRVINKEDVAKRSVPKQLKTLISRNDGALWTALKPPSKDSNGKSYSCSSKECSLNLHHYTERTDPRHTFGSPSGVGLMFGIGNVGEQLKGFADGDTFMTRDGGMTWTEVKKGQYLWEFGDQGSIIVIVDRSKPTDTVYYTLDEGKSWVDFKFGEKLKVFDISTVPSDTSRKFILWGRKEGGGDKFRSLHLDFSGITSQQCVFAEDERKQDEDDFELWTPPMEGSDCIFGHVTQYNRKIPSHRCYVGRKIPTFHKIIKNCTCTAADFECDYNYERVSDNSCKLIPGLKPPNHEETCSANPDLIEWYVPTGFRRLPMTTCQGGLEWDKGESRPCPGKDEEYDRKHRGLGGFGLFMAIVTPIVAAAAVGWYVWTQLLQRRFGAIRLGEENQEPSFVQYPIIAVAAVIAVISAIPSIVGAIGRWVGAMIARQRRYTTRSSFSRRGGYSVVNTDEGELLGSDDEDEV